MARPIKPPLRSRESTWQHAAQAWEAPDDSVAKCAALRQWKNEFK